MVTRFILPALTLLLLGCSPGNNAEQDQSFNVETYRIENVAACVSGFLNSRPETVHYPRYSALFVNVKGCSSCLRTSFSSLEKYLSTTNDPTFIYFNDSSLLDLVPANTSLKPVFVTTEKLNRESVFHTYIYMYSVVDRKIKNTLLIGRESADSLNRLN